MGMTVTYPAPDVNPPHRVTEIHAFCPYPFTTDNLTERDWLDFINDAIYRAECHEIKEWLMVDGKQVYPPH